MFNTIMRIVNTLLGIAMVAMGGIWILQGLGVAFQVGFMAGDSKWALYGVLLAVVGVLEIIWSNTRRAYSANKSLDEGGLNRRIR